MGRISLVALLVSVSGELFSQINRYMVFFTDKTGTPFSISVPENFLSERAIQRRANQEIVVIEQDLPVVPGYVDQVANTGATVLYKTKWMNGVLIEATDEQLTTVSGLSCVTSTEYVAPGGRPASGRMKSSAKFKDTSGVATATDVQLSMLGIDNFHAAGFHGEGMLIAVMDAGFPSVNITQPFQHLFTDSRFDASTSYNFVSGSSNVFTRNSHGTNVLSIIGAHDAGTYTGGAYKATFIAFITEDIDTEYRVEEYNWLFAAERADSAGADVINTSLGYNTFDDSNMNYTQSDMDGETAAITRAATIASSKGMVVVISAGNEGSKPWGIITTPADSEHVLAVGSVNSSGILASSSSVGPTADGRVKPDVAAMGVGTSVINTSGTVVTGGGTSFAAPLIASLAAIVWQQHPTLTAAEVRDSIRIHGSQFLDPDNFLGFGIPYFGVITAVDPTLEKNTVAIYPNPSNDWIRIEFDEDFQQSGSVSFDIVDSKGASGSITWQAENDRTYFIRLSDIAPGLYVLRCWRGKQLSVHKVLKVK
ncbi:MAG: S8 family serine peptidase [Cyclobacteriaceae bacterium]